MSDLREVGSNQSRNSNFLVGRFPKLVCRCLLSAALLVVTAVPSHALNYVWDTSTTAGFQPGTGGTWDTTGSNLVWTTTGTTLLPWAQTNATTALHTATFSGADGTYGITLGTGIAVQTVTVSNSGYTLSAATPQTLNVNNVGSGIFTIADGKTFTVGNNATISYNGVNNTGTRYNLGNGAIFNVAAGGTLTKVSGTGLGGFGFRPNAAGNSATINVDGTISWTSSNAGSGSLTFGESVAGLITVNVNNGGVITTNTGGQQNLKGGITIGDAGTAVLNMSTGSNVSITSSLASSFLCIGGTGNTGVGTVNLNGGTLSVPQISKKGSGTASGTMNFNGGTLTATSNLFNTTANAFIGAAGNTGGSGTLALDRANVRDGGALINTNGFDVTITQPLLHSNIGGDAAVDGGLTKSGGGTMTLTAANTYTGATSVNNGTLNVTGSLTSAVNVASGATMRGTGSTTGLLTMNSGSTLNVDPVGGDFAAAGVNFAGPTQLVFASALTPSTTYDVVTYSGGSLSGLANLVQTSRGTLNDVTGVKVTFTAGSVLTDTWNTTSGNWDVGTATSWSNGNDSKFWNGDTVVFDDTPGAAATATLVGSLNPAAMNVSNPTVNHTWTGAGSITGAAALTKSGAGSLTIANGNAFTGGTTLNAGTLVLNNATAIGTGALTIAGGAVDSTNATTLTSNNAVNVNGDFAFTGTTNLTLGSGVVTLGGAGSRTVTLGNGATLGTGRITSTATGLTLAGSGKLAITQSAASSIVGELNVGSGTTLQMNTGANAATTNDVVVTGLTGSGTVENGGGVERWLFVNNSADYTFNGVLQNGGGGGAAGLNKQGAGKLTLAGTNTYTGPTNISANGGTLEITGSAANTSLVSFGGSPTNAVLKINTAVANPVGTGTLSFSSNGNASTDRVELSGGTSLANPITLFGRTTTAVAIQNVSGNNTLSGTISGSTGGSNYTIQSDAGELTLSNATAITQAAGTGARSYTLQGAGNGVVGGAITNGTAVISITKAGAGTWKLGGANTYTGTTTVSGGALILSSGASLASASTVSVNGAGSVLGGNGTVGGATTVTTGGAIAPGESIGTLTFSGTVGVDSASSLQIEYDDATQTIDLLAAGGTLTLDGNINFAPVNGSLLTLASYTFATFSSISGVYTTSNVPAGYSVVQSPTSLMLNAIPEASTILCGGVVSMLVGAGAMLRRRKQRS